MKIDANSLWVVVINMPARTAKVGISVDNQDDVIIKSGEIIEFRYHYGIHFRTVTNDYYYVDESVLKKHCKIYGHINHDVWLENQTHLDDILKRKLYTQEWSE